MTDKIAHPVFLERFDRLAVIVRGMAHNMRPCDGDMLQAGLLDLWEMVCQYSDKPDSYLVSSARYAMIDHRRLMSRRERWKKLKDVICQRPPPVGPDGDEPDAELDDLLRLLDNRTRAAFVLHVLTELTIAETAEKLATSTRTVERLCQKAKAILKREMS